MINRRTSDPRLDVDPIPTNYEDIVIACYERVTMGVARGGLGPFFYRFNGPGGLSRS